MDLCKECNSIDGFLVLTSSLHHDDRGYFLENWKKNDLIKFGVPEEFFNNDLKNNVSVSNKGTLRGMHCQGWAKLMTVAWGTFRMCFVDLRRESATYKKVMSLDMKPGMVVFVPEGVANGAQSLVENGILNYIVTGYYNPNEKYLGITPLDPKLNLPWDMITTPIISEKDKGSLSYDEVIAIIESDVK